MGLDGGTTDIQSDAAKALSKPWVTIFAIIACLATFTGLAIKNDYQSWDTLALFGYLPAEQIRAGGFWALITSTFVHFEMWHVAFNVYWLWLLGSRIEGQIGSRYYLAFFVAAAFFCSAVQLATSETTGIGASGVVYAIFGYMWPTRRRYPAFAEVLDRRTIQLFIIWMVGCIIAEVFEIADIGNAAHVSGLLFGAVVAGGFALHLRPKLFRFAAGVLLVIGTVSLFWCPWSVSWLSTAAYDAHVAEDYSQAISYYSKVVRIDPQNAWAYLNRSYAFDALGENDKASADLEHAREIDPDIESRP